MRGRGPGLASARRAAGIGLAGITAVDAVNTLGLHAGDTVFTSGLAGAGAFALQLAKRQGSRVTVAAKPGEERGA